MEKKIIKKVGEIEICNGSIDITDPCYDKNVWCRDTFKNMKNGIYSCYVVMSNEGKWGWRVDSSAIVYKQKSEKEELDLLHKFQYVKNSIWEIGVDAGMAGYFTDKPDFNDGGWSMLCDSLDLNNNKYWIRSFDNNSVGFFTDSGFGDGGYPVFAIADDDDCFIAVKIKFIF